LVLPHVYWLLVVKGIRPIALLPANAPLHLGIALLAAGVLPVGLLVFAAARCRLRFGGAASLGLIAAVGTAVLNYWVISWWYAEYFYNA
jgi:hypothetical protein